MFTYPFLFLLVLFSIQSEKLFFRSEGIDQLIISGDHPVFHIVDDKKEEVRLEMIQDQQGLIYWYRRVETPVCLTGECMLIDIGIYWDCTGDFYGLDVYGFHLTKTDHTIFSPSDYGLLIKTLKDDWSILREYELSELTIENPDRVDGTSGATRKEIASETVENAVYTTYTIWHLAHLGEKEQLTELTIDQLEGDIESFQALVDNGSVKYKYFILEILSKGKLNSIPQIAGLVAEGICSTKDLKLKALAFDALDQIDLGEPLQQSLATGYPTFSIQEKMQVLSSLKDIKKFEIAFYEILAKDLVIDNAWFLTKLLSVLRQSPYQSEQVLSKVRDLENSDNQLIREAANEFLKDI